MRQSGIGGPPRTLVVLIAATTVVPLVALLWLGWKVLAQDRHLEVQQARASVERAADLIAAALQRAIAASEQRLAAGAGEWSDGAVALTLAADRVEATPRHHILFLPAIGEPPASPLAFSSAEQLEFRDANSVAAAAAYRRLALSPDREIRAGAMFRLARALRPSDPDGALAQYSRLLDADAVFEGAVPLALAARYMRCALLEQEGRSAELRLEAGQLAEGLHGARWPLTGSTYAVYAADVARWVPDARPPDDRRLRLAEAAAQLWEEWRIAAHQGQPARRSTRVRGEPVAILWQTTNVAPRVLIADRGFVESQWLRSVTALTDEHKVQFALQATDGTPVFTPARTATQPARSITIARSRAQTDLPWALAVTGDASPYVTEFATRRRLLVAGFVLLVFMALVASYLIIRAVGRELAVARLRAEFVAAVSHEFRTPLTSLRQFTDMLRDRPSMDDERRRVCYDAQARATDRLSRLVESVLDLGRIEAGVRTYASEPHDCTEFVRRIVDEFRSQPEAAGHAVHFGGNGEIPIRIDTEAVSRAVWNVLDNAVKYSPAGSDVRVGVARDNGTARIAVRDDGMGLASHERAAVFAKFRRGEQAVKRGIKGTGIGLAMAHEIITAHGGRIDVESERDAGSTFTIVLPVKE